MLKGITLETRLDGTFAVAGVITDRKGARDLLNRLQQALAEGRDEGEPPQDEPASRGRFRADWGSEGLIEVQVATALTGKWTGVSLTDEQAKDAADRIMVALRRKQDAARGRRP